MRKTVLPVCLAVVTAGLAAGVGGALPASGSDGRMMAYPPIDGPVLAEPSTRHPWDQSHRPCKAEDGPGPCFWNADSRGNQLGADVHLDRRGRSYTTFRDVRGPKGHLHDACWIHVGPTSLVWCEDGFRSRS